MRKLDRPYTDPSYLFRHGGAAAPGLLDFSASINPLGPSPLVRRAIRQALPDIARYPDPECRALTAKLAELHRVAPEQVVVGNGSNELIHAITRALRPQHVAIVEPTYTEYLRASLQVGAAVDHWLAEGTHFDLAPIAVEGADLVWLCNPNNPTGRLWSVSLRSWMAENRRSTFVVDEAFLPLTPSPYAPAESLLVSGMLPENAVVLRSLTKLYAIAGIRLGYAVARQPLAEKIRAELPAWSVNGLAQAAGIAALADKKFLRRTRSSMAVAILDLHRALRELSTHLHIIESPTAFILLRLKTVTAPTLCARLAERGIAIRDASNFVGLDERYVRIAVRLPQENQRLLTELKSILEG